MRACFLSEIYGIKKAGLIGVTSPPVLPGMLYLCPNQNGSPTAKCRAKSRENLG